MGSIWNRSFSLLSLTPQLIYKLGYNLNKLERKILFQGTLNLSLIKKKHILIAILLEVSKEIFFISLGGLMKVINNTQILKI